MLSLCRNPVPVADLASEIDLPIGVVRVLLGDLVSAGLVRIHSTKGQPAAGQRLLRMVLDGLESL
jgi:DNA-binding IclR family transcriptional regulator